MARQGRGRTTARARRLRGMAWLVGGGTVLVVGLVVGAQLFDGDPWERPTRTLESEGPAAPMAPPATWDRIRVEVLNGSGVPGVAATARDRLRDHGFDVVFYGNAVSFDHERTRVLARTGSLPSARAVAEALGRGEVAGEPDSTRFVDVTVILGADWTGETPQGDPPSGEVGGTVHDG